MAKRSAGQSNCPGRITNRAFPVYRKDATTCVAASVPGLRTTSRSWEFRGRKYILFHAGNDALKELRGCIAPVLQHTGEGRGLHSRMALQKMKDRLYPVLDKGIELTLTVKEAKS